MSKIGKAFMSLMLDKKARESLQNAAQRPVPAAPPSPDQSQPSQASVKKQLDAKLDEVQNRPHNTATPDRKQLIQNALRVHKAKQEVLSDLSDEQKLKLQVLAMKAMMPKPPGGGPGGGSGGNSGGQSH